MGSFRTVLLVGEPGVGKTRLAVETLARARPHSTVLSARGYPLGGSVPFALWAEAFESHLRTVEESQITVLCEGFLDDLAVLLRSAAAARPGGVPMTEPPLPRLQAGLAAVLAGLAARRPVVVFLDDAHDADASSWRLLDYFARHLSDAKLLVVVAARAGELFENEAAAEVVLRLEQEGRLTRLAVSPLSKEAIHDLARGVVGREPSRSLVDWLADRSLGNPLYALSLLGGLLDEGADLSSPVLRSLPEGLAERVGTQLRRLDEAARHVLEVMAVVGHRLEARELARVCGRTPEQLEPALARLTRSGLAAEEERGRLLMLEIAHPLIRETVYEGLSRLRRTALHREVGRALLGSERLAEAAPHFARAADVGDDEAIGVLLAALAEAERRQAYHEAMTMVSELVGLLPASDRRWLHVLDAMPSHAPWVLDHGAGALAADAIRAMSAISALLDATGDDRRPAVKLRLASLLAWGEGDPADAAHLAEEAGRLFDATGDVQNALLAGVEVAAALGISGDLAGMQEKSRAVARQAEAKGERFAAVQALRTEGWAAWFRGQFGHAEKAFRRSIEVGHEDAKGHRVSHSMAGLALTFGWQGDVDEARRLLEEGRAANPAFQHGIVLDWLILIDWIGGNYRGAVATGRRAAASRPTGPTGRRGVGLAVASMAATELGDLETAQQWLAGARAPLHDRPYFGYLEICRWAEALVRYRAGDTARSVALLIEASRATQAIGFRTTQAGVLLDLADIAVEAARFDVAAAAAEELGRVADEIGCDVYRALAATAAAIVATATGDAGAAVRKAGDAVEILSLTGWDGYLGRSLLALGRALGPAARPEAVTALERSAGLFESCGADRRREQALSALRALGSGGRKAAAAALGAGSLTRREAEVARLAAQGKTARQIGEQLHIGERTVEWHLANVYAKVGVDSRFELARRLSQPPT